MVGLIGDRSHIDAVEGGTIRARQVREMLMGTNTDPKVKHILEALAEANHEGKKEIAAMSGAISQMADIISNFTLVAENMKSEIIKMRGETSMAEPELGPVTQ